MINSHARSIFYYTDSDPPSKPSLQQCRAWWSPEPVKNVSLLVVEGGRRRCGPTFRSGGLTSETTGALSCPACPDIASMLGLVVVQVFQW